MKNKGIYLALLVMLSPMAANADLVFDNGSSTTHLNGWCSDCSGFSGWTLFDDFTVADDVTITDIDWDAALLFPLGDQTIEIGIWSGPNSGNLVLWSFLQSSITSVLNATGPSRENRTFSTSLTPFALTAGTYYLSIYGSSDMYFPDSAGNAIQFHPEFCPSGCARTGFLSARLYGTSQAVPEPSTLALLGLGLVGMAARRRKV